MPAAIVDRSYKGDRLPLVPHRISAPAAPNSGAALTDGCDALVSPLTRSELARVAVRCVS
jgi:hypothetical protein